jgi:hypothetical protein
MTNSTDFGRSNFKGDITLQSGNNGVTLRAPGSLANSYTLTYPGALPGTRRYMVLEANGTVTLDDINTSSSVTSVGLALPNFFTVSDSPVTSSGTLTAVLNSQTARTFLAAPTGSNGVPTFRALAYGDISGIVGAIANTLCAGNDSRLHNPNTDTGTTNASFQIDSNNSGARLKNAGGVLQVRNALDTQLAVLECDEIRARLQTISDTTVIAYNDAVLRLNSDFTTGTPTEDIGIEGLRGSSPTAQFVFTEANGWVAGVVGSLFKVVRLREFSFVFADLVSGILTVNHNLGRQIVNITLAKPGTVTGTYERIGSPDGVTYVNSNQLTIDLTNFGAISGTWFAVVEG